MPTDATNGRRPALECPRLWRITDLSLVVNKQDQRAMKMAIRKNIFGLSVVLEWNVENSKILSY